MNEEKIEELKVGDLVEIIHPIFSDKFLIEKIEKRWMYIRHPDTKKDIFYRSLYEERYKDNNLIFDVCFVKRKINETTTKEKVMRRKTNSSHFYIRTLHRHPVGVVAFRSDNDGVHISVAIKSPKDVWVRREGLERAYGRSFINVLEHRKMNTFVPFGKKISLEEVLRDLKMFSVLRKNYMRGLDFNTVDFFEHEKIFARVLEDHMGERWFETNNVQVNNLDLPRTVEIPVITDSSELGKEF